MNRLARLIQEMNKEDLLLLQRDLQEGNLAKLIKIRLDQLEERKQCPTCGEELTRSMQKFSLEFGPKDLRQKAYFDEYDCLRYFLAKLAPEAPEVRKDNE